MGQSTDALLAFGIDFQEKSDFPWDAEPWDGEFDKWWANEKGVAPPTEEYSETNASTYHDYWEKARELEKTCPVEVVGHCSGDYRMWVIAIRGTIQKAWRGDPVEAKITETDGTPLVEFCAKYGLETEAAPAPAPKWLLFSDWN